MDRYFCEVVPVYVRPQSMVDEQACFGVIVRCPAANFYGYRLARGDEAAIARIVSFFPRYGRVGLDQAMTWAAQVSSGPWSGRHRTSNTPLTASGPRATRVRSRI